MDTDVAHMVGESCVRPLAPKPGDHLEGHSEAMDSGPPGNLWGTVDPLAVTGYSPNGPKESL